MTAETLDRPTRRRIEKAAAKKEKLLIRVRTEMRTGNGTYFSPWRILKDDPKNGIYDLTNWKRKYQAFDGHYASRKRYPSRYRDEKNVWYATLHASVTRPATVMRRTSGTPRGRAALRTRRSRP